MGDTGPGLGEQGEGAEQGGVWDSAGPPLEGKKTTPSCAVEPPAVPPHAAPPSVEGAAVLEASR